MDWSPYYPAFVAPEASNSGNTYTEVAADEENTRIPKLVKDVEVADIGCGFGGLLVALAPKLPDKLLLGEHLSTHN
jgi:tRNA (guanine-N7-)-methyltransferase